MMPSHYCLDPHDQYSQAELLVEFEGSIGNLRLLSARNHADEDVLSDLEDTERRALENEISADYRHITQFRDNRILQCPVRGQP